MPLSENDMERIAEEEIYRQEVRANLEKDKLSRPTKEKVWEYVNSPLALWFLFTVVGAYYVSVCQLPEFS